VRIGVDIERVDRFAFLQRPVGGAFYRRVYTAAEQQLCGTLPVRLARCFAAKEAVAKALGTGLAIADPDRVACIDMEMGGGGADNAWRTVTLTGKARAVARTIGVRQVEIASGVVAGVAYALAGVATTASEVCELHVILDAAAAEVRHRLSAVRTGHDLRRSEARRGA